MRTLALGWVLVFFSACSGGAAPNPPPNDLTAPSADLAMNDLATDPAHGPIDFSGFDANLNTHGGGPGDPRPDGGNLADGGVYRLPDGGAFQLPDLAPPPSDMTAPPPDLAVPSDLAGRDLTAPPQDLAPPPPQDLASSTAHAPSTLSGVTTLLAGQVINDVSTDQGGGVWAVTDATVYYFPSGKTTPFTYDQRNGLARGWYTWKPDPYYSGAAAGTVTWPVTFSSVAGGISGEAVVGNVGAIADRLQVDPATGAIVRVDNMAVTAAQQPDPTERAAQQARVVATHRVVVDLNGTFNGTAYVGGWHGFSAFHGVTGDCGCLAFEEHQHYFGGPSGCDNTPNDPSCFDGDVRGLAITATGDVWAGDRHFVQLLPQRSKGASTDFFESFAAGFDVFPFVKDEVAGLAVDAQGGVYVASDGNGLAYLAPGTYAPSYWSSLNRLTSDHLTGVAVDRAGAVWLATDARGVIRYQPSSGTWIYYTQASGLPSDRVRAIYVDPYVSPTAGKRTVYFATDVGVGVYGGP